MRVVQLWNGGLSVAEIAEREGVTAKRMRAASSTHPCAGLIQAE